MKHIPNILSGSRLLLAVLLLFLVPYAIPFMVIYIVAGLTDAFDGPLARRLGATSKLGSNLDSVADLALGIIVLFRIIPVMDLPSWGAPVAIFIVALRVLEPIVGVIRFKKFVLLHTIGIKAAAWVVFLFPILYWVGVPLVPLLIVCCVLAFIGFGEGFLISLISKEQDMYAKGLFYKKK
ncbi:MAG: CDP-alcohol phosphatidyltransferase family protein [Defluviitaleaceae bacterium]|nr:CDP-alcohol phosphatidyltransferase family protein [Defluviitaleaceae bacterium]